MKGILLAGGSGSRLYPLTTYMSKQLLPIYNKPTLYYPLSIFMLAEIRDILIMSTPRDLQMIESLFGSGKKLGLSLSYQVQPEPKGIAQAFLLGASFIGDQCVSLILGDNIFYGEEVHTLLHEKKNHFQSGAQLFLYHVHDPERYGVAELDASGQLISLEEKPKKPKSSWVVTGLYCYDSQVTTLAKELRPSARGELEITDLNLLYLKQNQLKTHCFKRGVAWLDTGTYDSLLVASQFVQTLEQRQGFKVACIEEIAYQKKYISQSQFEYFLDHYGHSPYGKYLRQVYHEQPT